MKVRVLLRVHHDGRFREPGEIIDLAVASVIELPRWCIEERPHHPANTARRQAGFGFARIYDSK